MVSGATTWWVREIYWWDTDWSKKSYKQSWQWFWRETETVI